MKTVADYQKEHDLIIQQLKEFQKNLPQGLALVDGKVIENEKVVVASFIYEEDRYLGDEGKNTATQIVSKMIKVKVKNLEEFKEDLSLLALKFEEAKNTESLEDIPPVSAATFKSKEFKKVYEDNEETTFSIPNFFYELFIDFVGCEFKGWDACNRIIEHGYEETPIPVKDYLVASTDELIKLERSQGEDETGDPNRYMASIQIMDLDAFKKEKKKFDKEKTFI